MGDGLKITNGKRHRSSSSLAGVLDSVRSEKRLDVRASIPEVEDQYAMAETRCDSLQEKIDLVKAFKRKKKLKKRSMTTITEPVSNIENVPMITIRTRPKKKSPQQPERFSKASNVMHGYVDPDLIEQRRMISRVQGQSPTFQQQNRHSKMKQTRDHENTQSNFILQQSHTDDDSEPETMPKEVCGGAGDKSPRKKNTKPYPSYKSHNFKTNEQKFQNSGKHGLLQFNSATTNERPQKNVIEIFKKDNDKRHDHELLHDIGKDNEIGDAVVKNKNRNAKGLKFKTRHFELPTVSSSLKQSDCHSYQKNCALNQIPFVISKSSAPSHNIGLNLQQVLMGVKLKQPVSNIPLTIANQMGLRNRPISGINKCTLALSSDQLNTIQIGEKSVYLPSYKKMSYGRVLSLYKENNTVARFLGTVGQSHHNHASLYNLYTKQDDFDGATSKGQGRQDAKQNLAEYASLYRQYEQVDKQLDQKYDPILQKQKDILLKKLTERENYIRKLVGGSTEENDEIVLGASVSATEDDCLRSNCKLTKNL